MQRPARPCQSFFPHCATNWDVSDPLTFSLFIVSFLLSDGKSLMQRCFVFPDAGIDFCWPAWGHCVAKVVLLGYWTECFMSPEGTSAGKLGFEARLSRIGTADCYLLGRLSLLVLITQAPSESSVQCEFVLVTQEAFGKWWLYCCLLLFFPPPSSGIIFFICLPWPASMYLFTVKYLLT